MQTTKINPAGKWLEVGAAASFARMVAAAGTAVGLAAAGRTRAEQQVLYDLWRAGKGNLAAKPGTSLHESGLAIDVTRNSALQRWMVAGGSTTAVKAGEKLRAHDYGWYRTVPSEPWHFRYYPAKDKRKPGLLARLATLARVGTFNCGAWGKTSMSAKQIDAVYGVLATVNGSILCLTECPEWLRNHLRGVCKCPVTVKAGGHRRFNGKRWLVLVRGSQAIMFDSQKWKHAGATPVRFGPTDYHGGLFGTFTSAATRAALTVGCYHLPPNTVAMQSFQKRALQGFLAKLGGTFRLAGGDGADDTGWFAGWSDTRTAAAESPNRAAPTYKGRAITDRIHTRGGITVRRYTVVPSGGASDHDAVLAQITIPAHTTTN